MNLLKLRFNKHHRLHKLILQILHKKIKITIFISFLHIPRIIIIIINITIIIIVHHSEYSLFIPDIKIKQFNYFLFQIQFNLFILPRLILHSRIIFQLTIFLSKFTIFIPHILDLPTKVLLLRGCLEISIKLMHTRKH